MSNNSKLFEPITFRELKIKNRIFMSPMCQYSSDNTAVVKPWHMVHLGSRAVGGVGLIIQEATAVSSEGRISAQDLGLWNEEQAKSMAPINDFIKSHGAVPAIQLAHAGRKGSAGVPIVAPSAIPFDEKSAIPTELNSRELKKVLEDFVHSAELALKAGFEVIEIHMAHGYLLHEFLSPLSNLRNDEFGGSLENRMRFPLQVAEAIRKVWPAKWPLFVRISATDWIEGGWDLAQSVELSRRLKTLGVDLIDCSSGGTAAKAKIPVAPGYQVPFEEEIRAKVGISTGAVGLITEAEQAEEILQKGQADVVFLARELLRNPQWALRAAKILNVDVKWPYQYERAKN
jgi:2,4-dienoyl-CoA reductase-like NADH-dependent reductase (Old Yellow Enzyme family)